MKNPQQTNALLLFALLFANSQFAQNSDVTLDHAPDFAYTTLSIDSEDPCFDIGTVLNNCTPVHIRVNFHFFTQTNCLGNVQVADSSQMAAYQIAEDMVDHANDALANNPVQWQSPGAALVCNPIRYMLSGVYIHCLSNAVGGGNTSTLHAQWGEFKSTEINIYIANYPGAGTGFAGSTYISIDWLNTGNLNHELGHVFGLSHTFDASETCTDTPRVIYNWDKNCNGILDPGEQYLQCWNHIEADQLPGTPGFTDYNNNGAHDCNESPPCSNSPCCSWAYVDNNVMSYNAYQASYTKCQLTQMLSVLSLGSCNFIEKIDGCPPPHAFISQTPESLLNTTFCQECIVLQGSYNEESYLFEIWSTSDEQMAYSSGWTDGKASNFCFYTTPGHEGHFLKPHVEYKAVLTVRNSCDEQDAAEYIFTTPDTICATRNAEVVATEKLLLSPNPVSDWLQVGFDSSLDGQTLSCTITSLEGKTLHYQQVVTPVQGRFIAIPVGQLQAGMYTLSVRSESSFYQSRFIKI